MCHWTSHLTQHLTSCAAVAGCGVGSLFVTQLKAAILRAEVARRAQRLAAISVAEPPEPTRLNPRVVGKGHRYPASVPRPPPDWKDRVIAEPRFRYLAVHFYTISLMRDSSR